MITKKQIGIILIFFLFILLRIFAGFSAPPMIFPVGNLIEIKEDFSLSEIADELKQRGVVRSSLFFSTLARILGKEKEIKFGVYFFEKTLNNFELINRLVNADFGIKPIKITIPEGSTIKDIAKIFGNFQNFDKERFLSLAKDLEGYLFPDTYYFLPTVTEEEIIKVMRENFDKKVGNIDYDVLIMASLIEKEVSDPEDRRIVSGILWKRLNAGMPLQVDATFVYFLGKSSSELTLEDLKIDSPYNTYLHKGLPPTPICNPGLDAIDAALHPVDSPYWYYLSDKEGNTHFARTFEEHKLNKKLYLWYK